MREKPPSGVQPWFWFGRHYRESFERIGEIARGYFGVEHMEALIQVLSGTDIPLIIHEAVTNISNKTVVEFGPYAKALSAVLPPMKLPSLFYGVVGGYGYFELKLSQNIGRYAALRSGVFQTLREIGNTILFVRLLETTLKKLADFEFQTQAFFQGITVAPPPPKAAAPGAPPPAPRESPFVVPSPPSAIAVVIKQTVQLLTQMGDKEQSLLQHLDAMAEAAPKLTEYESKHTSMLSAALERLTQELQQARVKEQWKGNAPDGDDILNVEKPNDIIRLWSSILFLFCLPPPETHGVIPVDDMTLFGEGFLWAGCLLIHLMGYRERFEFMDFSYHIMKLAALKPLPPEEDKKAKKSKKKAAPVPGEEIIPKARIFLKNIAHIKALNESIFASLETYLTPPKPVPFQTHPPDKDVNEFVPVRRLSLNPGDRKGLPVSASSATLSSPTKSGGPPSPTTTSPSPGGPDDDDDDDEEEKKVEQPKTPEKDDDDDDLLESKSGAPAAPPLDVDVSPAPGGAVAYTPTAAAAAPAPLPSPRAPSNISDGGAPEGYIDFDSPAPIPGFSMEGGEAPQLPDSFEEGF
jgi:hypothetical protein